MLFEREEPLDVRPLKTRTLLISVGIHLLLVAVIALDPEFLTSPPKRIIRIAGQDYDLSKNQITELVVPPEARPKPPAPAENKPLIEPPPQQNLQPPPPPPPPPAPQPPPALITPEDVIAEGARPDAQP